MHTYISKWTYLCIYTKMSLELVLQGLCRFFFLFSFFLYKGFYLCCGFTVSAATGRRDTLFGWKLHNSSLIFSFKHKPAINTSPAHRRVHIVGITWTTWETHVRVSCWDTSDSAVLGGGFVVFSPQWQQWWKSNTWKATQQTRGINEWKCAIIKNALCALVMSHTVRSLFATLSLS